MGTRQRKQPARPAAASRGAARAPVRRRRFLPAQRWARALIYLGIVLAYMTILWFWVFPWVDRTFINRPAL